MKPTSDARRQHRLRRAVCLMWVAFSTVSCAGQPSPKADRTDDRTPAPSVTPHEALSAVDPDAVLESVQGLRLLPLARRDEERLSGDWEIAAIEMTTLDQYRFSGFVSKRGPGLVGVVTFDPEWMANNGPKIIEKRLLRPEFRSREDGTWYQGGRAPILAKVVGAALVISSSPNEAARDLALDAMVQAVRS